MPWTRLLTGVLLALLAREALAPARAAGSCGDYVTVTHPSGHSSSHAPARPVKGLPDSVPDDPARQGNAPCHGPSCSGDPAPSDAPVSTGRGDGEERWDCLLTPPTAPAARAFGLPLEQRFAIPFRLPTSIYHPPRPR